MEDELVNHSVAALGKLFASKALSPVELLENTLQRVDKFDAALNAFSYIDHSGARAAAKKSESRWLKGEQIGPLDGIPTSIKDIVWSKKWVTTYGSHLMAGSEPAPENAPCIARLLEAGAVLFGMTNTPEVGWKAVTDSPRGGITRNPWNCATTPGGSSGGASAASAMGLGHLHVGTDGGGSVRIPAGFTGIVGHKPTLGRVPIYPASAFSSVAHAGPMARSVSDAASMLSVLAQPDVRDWSSLPPTQQDYNNLQPQAVSGLRIAYSETLGYVQPTKEVAESVRHAASVFEDLGASVEAIDPGFECPLDMFNILWYSFAESRISGYSEKQKEQLDPGLVEIANAGAKFSKQDLVDANQQRSDLGTLMGRFHQQYDLLLTPTIAMVAFEAGCEVPAASEHKRWLDWAGYSYPFNLTHQPACSVPCGLSSDGLPIGLQIIGRKFADDLVLNAAKAYEQTRDWRFPASPVNPVT